MAEERFESEFTLEERAHVLAKLEFRARRVVRNFLIVAGCGVAFVFTKVAATAALVLLPLAAVVFVLHHWACVRVWRSRKGAQVVVWLRRFNRKDLRRFGFGSLLQQVCGPDAVTLTIQDSTYRVSYNSIIARGPGAIVVIGLGALVAGGAVLFGIVGVQVQVSKMLPYPEAAMGLVTLLLGVPFALWTVRTVVRRAGYTRLRAPTAVRRLRQRLNRIRRGWGTSALQIFKCGDGFWRDVIAAGLADADAVVVDVTAIGRNVRWELSQVAALVRPERIVLCCASREGRLLAEEATLMGELLAAFGAERLARTRRVVYHLPAAQPWIVDIVAQRFRDFAPTAVLSARRSYASLAQAVTLALEGRAPEEPMGGQFPPRLPSPTSAFPSDCEPELGETDRPTS